MTQDMPAGGTPDSLLLDFLLWLEPRARSYADTMDVWRTSCPRLTVWEDAVDAGWIVRKRVGDGEAVVMLTPRGRRHLDAAPRSGQRQAS